MPFAYLDLDLLDHNIRQVVNRAAEKRVRLASKSLRSVAIIRRILAANSCFQGIMCYTALEAVYLASQGFTDLLVGYPVWNAQDIAAVAQATATGAQITLMVDSLEHVEQIEGIARQHGVRLPVCLEIDMSMDLPGLHFGVWRSPLRTPEQARPVIERIMASPHVWLDGLMGYEAQIAGVGDNFPGRAAKNAVTLGLKRRSIREVAQRRAAFVELVKTYGLALRFVTLRLGVTPQRLLNVAAQKTFSALTELREKEARPSSRGPCHHSQLLGSSHPISPDTFVRLWFAYAMQCVLCARSGGLWHTVVFLPAEPIYCGTRKHYSVFKVLPRV